jgi:hypothetical protein
MVNEDVLANRSAMLVCDKQLVARNNCRMKKRFWLPAHGLGLEMSPM